MSSKTNFIRREQFVNLWKFATEEIFKILKHERLDVCTPAIHEKNL